MSNHNQLSPICFGCEPLGGTDWGNVNISDVESAIHRALELGVNFFDTAAAYGLGLSEQRLSQILGTKRHDVVIATKGGLSWSYPDNSQRASVHCDSSPDAIKKGIEDSLRRLRIEYLPVYYIHWPDPKTPISTTFEALMKIRDDGKIASIGCSNFSAMQIEEACRVAEINYAQVPLNILNGFDEDANAMVYKRNDIKIIAYNVLSNGLLTGKYNKDSKFLATDRRSRLPLFQGEQYLNALKKINTYKVEAESQGFTLAQYATHWALDQANVASVILGIKNVSQIEENWETLSI